MHSGRQYSLKEVALWTRRETLAFMLIAAVPTLLVQLAGWTWLTLPWLPIALVGTAVAFITGFKNSSSYVLASGKPGKSGAGFVNSSRIWGMLVMNLPPECRTRMVHRHIAWLTALRYQLREPRTWENVGLKHNAEYQRRYHVEEWSGKLEEDLTRLIGADEAARTMAKKTRALFLAELQAAELRELAGRGDITEFRLYEMEEALASVRRAGRLRANQEFPVPPAVRDAESHLRLVIRAADALRPPPGISTSRAATTCG